MRAGRTKTTSFSLDEATLRDLKSLARRTHGGNVSALLADVALRERKLRAAERFLRKYAVPPLSVEEAAAIDAEWAAAAAPPTPRGRRRRAA